jgi:peptidoglycan LD-endopeptidase CwlK
MNFSKTSLNRLYTCDPRLIKVAEKAIEISPIDFGIACGNRSIEDQLKAFKEKKSKCDGIKKKSMHNYSPSKAFDVYAWVNGKASWDKKHLSIIAGVILSVAKSLDIDIRWGGTFGSDEFDGWDMPHFELID